MVLRSEYIEPLNLVLLKVMVSTSVCIRSMLPEDVGIADESGSTGIINEGLWPLSMGCFLRAPGGQEEQLTMSWCLSQR